MSKLRRLASATAAVALTGGIMAAIATPAEAAWRVSYIYGWYDRPSCEAARANHGAGLDPAWGFVGPTCSYNSARAQWYYAYYYNNA